MIYSTYNQFAKVGIIIGIYKQILKKNVKVGRAGAQSASALDALPFHKCLFQFALSSANMRSMSALPYLWSMGSGSIRLVTWCSHSFSAVHFSTSGQY